MSSLTISAVMPAYNAEEYIGEALTAMLSQSRPPDEVIVVDDGSTDGTPDILTGFRSDVRVVRQANQGVAGAMNRCFAEARFAYVAKCDADDVWTPTKLERQAESTRQHPEIDVSFGEARVFGKYAGRWGMGPEHSRAGVVGPQLLGRTLFAGNPICPSSTFVRRSLFERLGPFRETRCEDYDFWMRALRDDAIFHYDPTTFVNYRRHDSNVSSNKLAVHESDLLVRRANTYLVSRRFARRVLAEDLFKVGRDLSDRERADEARAFFHESLRQRPTAKGLAWALIVSVPAGLRRPLADSLVSIKRTLPFRASALTSNGS